MLRLFLKRHTVTCPIHRDELHDIELFEIKCNCRTRYAIAMLLLKSCPAARSIIVPSLVTSSIIGVVNPITISVHIVSKPLDVPYFVARPVGHVLWCILNNQNQRRLRHTSA